MAKASKFLENWVEQHINSAPDELRYQRPESVLSNLVMEAENAGYSEKDLTEAAGGNPLLFVQKALIDAPDLPKTSDDDDEL